MSSPAALICFNTECRDSTSLWRRNGWRLWSGEYAQLCDRCASMFDEGRFCDTFHLHDSGWRCCQSCGKRVHCGCIVSLNTYVVLDPGGVECISCANKRSNLRCANPAWTSSPFADLSLRSSQFSRSVGVYHHPQDLYNDSNVRPCLQSKIPGLEEKNIFASNSFHASQSHNIQSECGSPPNGCLQPGALRLQKNGFNKGESQSSSVGTSLQPTFLKDRPNSAHSNFALNSASPGKNDSLTRGTSDDPKLNNVDGLQLSSVSHNLPDIPNETQLHCNKVEANSRSKNQLISRYLPRLSDQELQQLCGDSSSVVTPLFEKMLSVSDAGRIGRLVLPKRCAETYFPPISEPEGLPLKIQDVKGHEWIFQFRFWPNNNSRMYVLEGITACIQSMELEAGDVVTFSRLDPEGKLIMGFRKASTSLLLDQTKPGKSCNGMATHDDSKTANSSKLGIASGAKISLSKRKNGTPGSKSKRVKLDVVDVLELKITLEEAQGLLRPPSQYLPSVVMIEGFEFEEYEESPLVGQPTIVTKASGGSACPAKQEITTEQLQDVLSTLNPDVLSTLNPDYLKRRKEIDLDPGESSLEGLVVVGEGSQTITRQARHINGCSCIVCIQPPGGKGPKHDGACECSFCVSMRKRDQTMIMMKEQKHVEKEANPEQSNTAIASEPNATTGKSTKKCRRGCEDFSNRRLSSSSLVCQIDLNMQPERDEEISPKLNSGVGGRDDERWDGLLKELDVLKNRWA